MAKNNIYDLTISELILRAGAGAGSSNSGAPTLTVTNSSGSNEVPENFNGNMAFTSTVTSIPAGYTVAANSHVITYPTAVPNTVGSTDTLVGPSTPVILGALGSTFIVNSTVTLEHTTDPDIILVGAQTITSVLPIYYGVKAYQVTPDVVGLADIAYSDNTFNMTTSVIGRINVVVPITNLPVISITGPNGLIYTVASSFTLTVIGSLNHYVLNYDTQLTGTNIKTFTINY